MQKDNNESKVDIEENACKEQEKDGLDHHK